MSIDAKRFTEQLHLLGAGIANNAAQAMRAAVQTAEADAKSTTLYNDRTGALRQNTVGTADGLKGELRAATKYAKWVENGTPPHVITPRKQGGVLSFVVAGSRVFAKSVNHPGTAERPFMAHARAVGEQTLDHGLDYFTDAAIRKFDDLK